MNNRHLSRTVVLQTLFEWEFHQNKPIDEIIERNLKFFGEKNLDKDYIIKTTNGVIARLEELDKKIQGVATLWPLDQIPPLDKVLLRLSAYELLYSKEIPPKVAINEAVELGKTFGGPNTSKFVNGVLGTLYKTRYPQSSDAQPEEIEKEIKKRWKILLNKIRQSQEKK